MTGAGAAAAAAHARRMREQEEETMAQYTAQDLAGEWEFKFLRSARGEFKHPEKLRAYLDEEAGAGWTLVEKFDSSRLRLKRPVAARSKDSSLSFDPYRTSVGMSEGKFAIMLISTILLVVAAVIATIVLIVPKGP